MGTLLSLSRAPIASPNDGKGIVRDTWAPDSLPSMYTTLTTSSVFGESVRVYSYYWREACGKRKVKLLLAGLETRWKVRQGPDWLLIKRSRQQICHFPYYKRLLKRRSPCITYSPHVQEPQSGHNDAHAITPISYCKVNTCLQLFLLVPPAIPWNIPSRPHGIAS